MVLCSLQRSLSDYIGAICMFTTVLVVTDELHRGYFFQMCILGTSKQRVHIVHWSLLFILRFLAILLVAFCSIGV